MGSPTADHVGFKTAAALLLLLSTALGKLLNTGGDQVDNNLLGPAAPARISASRARDWVKISLSPPVVVNTRLGDRVELECEVQGAPAPEIQWFRGTELTQKTERINANAHLSTVPEGFHDKAGLAKIRSRLVIDCVTRHDEGFYTCVAQAGTKTLKAPPSLLLLSSSGAEDTCKNGEHVASQAPRIVAWNPTAMENIGVNLVLPCLAVGSPQPTVYWVDPDNNLVDHYRYHVLDNGDLAISSLSWSDMGQFKCIAENAAGRDSVTSFVYPVLNSQ